MRKQESNSHLVSAALSTYHSLVCRIIESLTLDLSALPLCYSAVPCVCLFHHSGIFGSYRSNNRKAEDLSSLRLTMSHSSGELHHRWTQTIVLPRRYSFYASIIPHKQHSCQMILHCFFKYDGGRCAIRTHERCKRFLFSRQTD